MSDEQVVRRSESELVGLCREAARRGITRRQFVERALVLGLSASAVGALAAACDSGSTTPDTSETLPPMDETKPAQITFYNWSLFLDPTVKKDFRDTTGIRVEEVYMANNEEMLAKVSSGVTGYDVICPSDYIVHVMIMSGLLEPLDMKYIPNFEHVDAPFRNPGYDNTDENGGLKYSVPYFSGATGYCQRTDKIATPQTSWATLWDTQYKGQINMLDDERDVLGAALKLLGYSVNTRSQAELDEATQKLIEQKPLVSAYDSTNIKRAIVGGQPLVMCWDGDALQAIDAMGRDAQAKKLVRFVHPIEGYSTWTDALVVPVGNNSRYGAHLWMDYLLEPQVMGRNTSYVWFLAPSTASREFTDPFALTVAPTEEEAQRGEGLNDLGEAVEMYDDAWRQVKSA